MYLSVIVLFSVILLRYPVTARSAVTIEERQDEDLSFCFGEKSICEYSNDLFEDCQNYLEELPQWYNCVCANGYVSVDEAWVL